MRGCQGGTHDCEGACVVVGGGMRGCQGACMVARGHAWLPVGHAWLLRGACMVAKRGACMAKGGACMAKGGRAWDTTRYVRYALRAGGTHGYWNAFVGYD